MIEIKRNNKVFYTLEDICEGSKLSRQLMDHHYIVLKFTTAEPVYFEIGDSVEIPDFGYFELTSAYFPKHNEETDGYDYEMQMDAYYMAWKNKICKYRPQYGANETSFKLTTSVDVHLNVILGNLKALGLKYNGKDYSVDYTTYNKNVFDIQKRFLVSYDSISILDALNAICAEDALNCEWWIDGSVIYLGYCEMVGQTTFEQGVNMLSMSQSESKASFITRLYAFGSDKNIPSGYFTGADRDVTTDGVATDYLMLPNKEVDEEGFYAKDGYIENINVVKNNAQAIEGVVKFDDEYPKIDCSVSGIKTYDSTVENDDGTKTTETFWQVTSNDSFATNFTTSWIKRNLTLMIKFTNGALLGMEFEVSFKIIDGKNYFEVVANDNYGRKLPDAVMCPKVGDNFFLYNWDATKVTETPLIPDAREALFVRAKTYYKKAMVDNSNFTCEMDREKFFNNGTFDYHPLGEQVKLINPMFSDVDKDGKHYRNSRIIGMEINLDIPYDDPQYIVGEKASYSRLGQLEDKVDSITVNGIQIGGSGTGGSGVYVIGVNDSTPATDSNVYSARRSRMEFLSKLTDDTAQGTITFNKIQKLLGGLQVGDFNAENGGSWTPDAEGRSHLVTDYLEVRLRGYIKELLSDRITVGNNFCFDKASNFAFDEDGNIIAHSVASENANEDEEKGFVVAQKDDETGKYKLCLDELVAWGLATVKQLHVKGDSTFDGDLWSKQFISGFLGGKGWGIYNKPITNAAGVQENKWTGEFDNLIVRGSLRVYEMIISQLLGENDNRVFTGMMEVDHYDAKTGRVYLDTQDGKLYNPFRRDDIIMVQQFNGMPNSSNDYYVTKNYELLITDAGCGSLDDGEKRLDWVTFTNFSSSMEDASPEKLIKKKDTFVRMDNLTDPDRKGIMQIITVGTAAPYLDVLYGLKTDPETALKGRLGNLQGIVHPMFGRLQGFGEYLCNLYAVGDFVLRRTGESIDTKFQVLENMFSSRFQKTSYELTNGENYLENGQFLEQVTDADTPIIEGWDINTDDETAFWVDANGLPVMVNSTLTVSGNRKVTLEQNDGRQMLRLQNCGLRQKNALIRQPGTHTEYVNGSGEKGENGLSKTEGASQDVQDTLYVNVQLYAKTAGTLIMGFEGCTAVEGKQNDLTAKTFDVAYSGEWEKLRMEGKWNGTGDFVVRYTGDCYIAIVTLTDEPLSDFQKTVSTQILQTATNIKLLGENIDKVNGTTTQLGIDLDAEKKNIRLYVDETANNTKEDCNEYTATQIKLTNDTITSTAESMKKYTDGSVTSAKSEIKQTTDSITSTVAANKKDIEGKLTSAKSEIKQTTDSISASVTQETEDREKAVTAINATIGEIQTSVSSKVDSSTYDTGHKAVTDAVNTAQATADQAVKDAAAASGSATDARSYAETQFKQTEKDIKAVAAKVTLDADGNVTNISTSGLVTTSNYTSIFAQYKDQTGAVVKSQIESFITMDDCGNAISNATIEADKINLTGHTMNFTSGTITIDSSNFKLDASGNVTMKGNVTATGGSIGAFNITTDSNGYYSMTANYAGVNGFSAPCNIAINSNGLMLTTGTTAAYGRNNYATIFFGNDTYSSTMAGTLPEWSNGAFRVLCDFSEGGLTSQTGGVITIKGRSNAVTALELSAEGGANYCNYAIRAKKGAFAGLRAVTRSIYQDTSVSESADFPSGCIIVCTMDLTVTLPSTLEEGTMYTFLNMFGNKVVFSNSKIRRHKNSSVVTSFTSSTWNEWIDCIYVRGYWYIRCSGD